MANPYKIFFKEKKKKNNENTEEIKHAERLGEIVSNNAAIGIGIKERVHINAAKARQATETKINLKKNEIRKM